MPASLLAHRGFWLREDERNLLVAFERAFERGYGVELDVRDLDGTLVVSHDPPVRGTLELAVVVEAFRRAGERGTLAINVKADGLQERLADSLSSVTPDRWFAFDMSIPDALGFTQRGLPAYTRHSDVERDPVLLHESDGVWLDDFGGGFISQARVREHLDAGRRVAIVSPELHRRDHVAAWDEWRRWDLWDRNDVALCTDHPDEAEVVFG